MQFTLLLTRQPGFLWNISIFHIECKNNLQNNLTCKIVSRKISKNKPGTSFSYSHLSNKRGAHAYRFWKIPPSTKKIPPSTFIDFINIFQPPCLFQPPRLSKSISILLIWIYYDIKAKTWYYLYCLTSMSCLSFL